MKALKYLKLTLLILLCFISRATAQDSLLIGEFTISKIIDGDTFNFENLDGSVRLFCIDTEETYKGKDAKLKSNSLAKNWMEYYYKEKSNTIKPAKVESPFGYETWQWTKELFKNVAKVRLESDEAEKKTDFYGRYLAYVIAIKKDGSEFNYNMESVKQGYSPYFSKYGYSKRFHKDFLEAQKYAQDNKLGIWSGKVLCYPDYKERLEWWNRRAETLKNFDKKYKGKKGYFSMLDENDYKNLQNYFNKTVIIFGAINKIMDSREPYLLRISHTYKEHLVLVVHQEHAKLMNELNIKNLEGELIYVKGKLSEYEGKYEIKLTDKNQIWTE